MIIWTGSYRYYLCTQENWDIWEVKSRDKCAPWDRLWCTAPLFSTGYFLQHVYLTKWNISNNKFQSVKYVWMHSELFQISNWNSFLHFHLQEFWVLGWLAQGVRSQKTPGFPPQLPFHTLHSLQGSSYTYHTRAWWNVQERAGGCEGLGGERLQVHTSKAQPWKGFQDNNKNIFDETFQR